MPKVTLTFEAYEPEVSPYYRGLYWTDIDGRRVAIKDLNNTHLLNIWKYLDRVLCEIKELIRPYFAPGFVSRGLAIRETEYHWNRGVHFEGALRAIQWEILRRGLLFPKQYDPKEPSPNMEIVVSIDGVEVYEPIDTDLESMTDPPDDLRLY